MPEVNREFIYFGFLQEEYFSLIEAPAHDFSHGRGDKFDISSTVSVNQV